MGLKPTEVAEGYERALEKALEVLETLSCFEVTSNKDAVSVEKAIRLGKICSSFMFKFPRSILNNPWVQIFKLFFVTFFLFRLNHKMRVVWYFGL